MAITAPAREDTYDVTVTVKGAGAAGGDLSLGTFDTMSGGNVEADDSKYRPGGLAAEISLGGLRTVENVTVGRIYDLASDHASIVNLANRVGAAQVIVSKQPLDRSGVKYGSPIVYTGTLVRVGFPDVDSQSSDASMWELEVSTLAPVVGPSPA